MIKERTYTSPNIENPSSPAVPSAGKRLKLALSAVKQDQARSAVNPLRTVNTPSPYAPNQSIDPSKFGVKIATNPGAPLYNARRDMRQPQHHHRPQGEQSQQQQQQHHHHHQQQQLYRIEQHSGEAPGAVYKEQDRESRGIEESDNDNNDDDFLLQAYANAAEDWDDDSDLQSILPPPLPRDVSYSSHNSNPSNISAFTATTSQSQQFPSRSLSSPSQTNVLRKKGLDSFAFTPSKYFGNVEVDCAQVPPASSLPKGTAAGFRLVGSLRVHFFHCQVYLNVHAHQGFFPP